MTALTSGLRLPLLVAGAGSLAYLLVGVLDLGAGQVVVAGVIGWLIGLAVRARYARGGATARRLVGIALPLAVGSVLFGLGLAWGWGLAEGTSLGPVAYLAERFGWLPIVDLAAAGFAATIRAA